MATSCPVLSKAHPSDNDASGRNPADPAGGGGVLEGTVERIGWTRERIVARRHSNFRGDPDGWMIVDVRCQTVAGPLSDSAFSASPDLSSIPIFSADSAWRRL